MSPHAASKSRLGGFTLIEVSAVVALVAGIVITLGGVQIYMLDRSDGTRDKEESLTAATSVANEILQAIRLSEEVLQAGYGVITVRTRYLVDTDDFTELVRYTLSGSQLLREVAEDGSSIYGAPEVLLEDVTDFKGFSMKIEDDLSRSRYESYTGPQGLNMSVDGAVKATNFLTDLGEVDDDLIDSYDPELERIEFASPDGTKTVTFSPEIPREGLVAEVDFVPFLDAHKYMPLAYGGFDLCLDQSVSILFEASPQRIALYRLDGGAVQDSVVSTLPWNELDTYRLRMKIQGSKMVGWVDSGGGFQKIGEISVGSVDNERVRVRALDFNSHGAWDNIMIDYPYVDFRISTNVDGVTQNFHSGAMSRVK